MNPKNKPKVDKNYTKTFNLNLNEKIYLLSITLINEKQEKIMNFNLKENNQLNPNNIIYYESNEKINNLGKLFLINLNKHPNIEEIILETKKKKYLKK